MVDSVNENTWIAWQEHARALGFREMGAAPAGPVKRQEEVTQWVAGGNHGEMHWYARSLEKRLNPKLALPGAESVIVLTMPYHKEACSLGEYKLARYACGDDYHDVVLKKLRLLGHHIHAAFPQATYRAYVDTGPVLERYWAEQAGLGWIGKNGNLISRRDGSYLFLASILTSLKVPYGQPHEPLCGSCRACLDICPTDAFISDGLLDSRKCISYLTIEHRGPFQNAPDFDNWLFGCDLCQEVCPWTQKFSPGSSEEAFLPRESYASIDAQVMEEMTQEDFSATFRKSPIKRTKLAGIIRNVRHLKAGITGSENLEEQE